MRKLFAIGFKQEAEMYTASKIKSNAARAQVVTMLWKNGGEG